MAARSGFRALVPARVLWLVLLAALAIRLGYLGLVYQGPDSLRLPDSPVYENEAGFLLGHCPPNTDCAADFTQRMPGYPLFLAGVRLLAGSAAPLWPVLAQCLIDALSCLLIAWLAGLLDRRLVLLAGLLAACNLNMITTAGAVLTESLFMPPFIAGLVAVILYLEAPSWRRALAAGLCLGAALLVRSVLLFFLPVLLAALALAAWRAGRGLRVAAAHLLLAALAALLCISPVLARNLAVYHRAALVSQGGQHALYWVAPTAREFALGIPYTTGRAEMQQRLEAHLAAEGRAALPRDPFRASDEMEAVAVPPLLELGVAGLAKAWLAGSAINLAAPALISVPSVARLPRPHFYETAGGGALGKLWTIAKGSAGSLFLFVMAPALLWMAASRFVALSALLRLGRAGGLPLGPSLYLLAVAAYFLAITGPVTGVKYRLPLEPLLIILLAAGLRRIGDAWRARRLSSPRPAGSTI